MDSILSIDYPLWPNDCGRPHKMTTKKRKYRKKSRIKRIHPQDDADGATNQLPLTQLPIAEQHCSIVPDFWGSIADSVSGSQDYLAKNRNFHAQQHMPRTPAKRTLLGVLRLTLPLFLLLFVLLFPVVARPLDTFVQFSVIMSSNWPCDTKIYRYYPAPWPMHM